MPELWGPLYCLCKVWADCAMLSDSCGETRMIRWQRDFGIALLFCGAIILSSFTLPSLAGGLGVLSGFFLAKAVGFDPLTILLRKLGVAGPIIGTALQVLEAEPRHKIPNVMLTQAMLRDFYRPTIERLAA